MKTLDKVKVRTPNSEETMVTDSARVVDSLCGADVVESGLGLDREVCV